MTIDLAIGVSITGAAVAGASAAAAIWGTMGAKVALSKEIESAFRQSDEGEPATPTFDVFLSYVPADSKELAEELAEALRRKGVRVWFDEDQIHVGDNVYAKLGEGITASKYGLVILSPHFFNRDWAQSELKAMLQRENEKKSWVLPIWHGVSHEEVHRYSPALSFKRALRSDAESVDEIAADIARIARPNLD